MAEVIVGMVMRKGWGQRSSSTRSNMKRASRPSAWIRFSRSSGLIAALGFDLGLAATCCLNSTSGLPFDSCTCLADNSQTTGQIVGRGESALYHWVLGGSNTELITTSQRGNLTFKVSPCSGSVRMDIKSASPTSWPFMSPFATEHGWNPAALTISVQASEYTVFVTAGNQSNTSTFDIATYNTLREAPNTGGGGILTATMPTTTTAAVEFNTSETASLGDLSYRLYWTSVSTTWTEGEGEEASPACVTPSDGRSLMDNPNCLFSSVCGMDRAAEGTSDWVTLSNDTGHHSFEAPVASGVQYIFNVGMRDTNNITATYRASNITFSGTSYRQCISDPDCESQVHTDSTVIVVCCLAATALVLLVGCTKTMRFNMRGTMEDASRKVAKNAISWEDVTRRKDREENGSSPRRRRTSTRLMKGRRESTVVSDKDGESGTDVEEDSPLPMGRGAPKKRLSETPSRRRGGVSRRGDGAVGYGERGGDRDDVEIWTYQEEEVSMSTVHIDGGRRRERDENGPLPRSRRTSTRPPVEKSAETPPRRRGGVSHRGDGAAGDGGTRRDRDEEERWTDHNEDGPSPRSRRTSIRPPVEKSSETPPRRRGGVSRRGDGAVGDGGTRRERDEEERWTDRNEDGPSPRSRRTSTQPVEKSSETPPRRRGGVSRRGDGAVEYGEREEGEEERDGFVAQPRRDRRRSVKAMDDMTSHKAKDGSPSRRPSRRPQREEESPR